MEQGHLDTLEGIVDAVRVAAVETMNTEEQQQEQLEDIVDKLGLATVLALLADICGRKVEHLLCNWQHASATRMWKQAAQRIDTARRSQAVQDLALAYGQNAS